MKRKFNMVWILTATDNYERILVKFLRKKVTFEDMEEIERVDKTIFLDDEILDEFHEINQRKMNAIVNENNKELMIESKRERRFLIKHVQQPQSFKLLDITSRFIGKTMFYLLLYKIE